MSSLERAESKLYSETLNPKRLTRGRADRRVRRPDRAAGGADRAGGARTDATSRAPMPRNQPLPTKTREVARGRTSCRGRREEQEEAGGRRAGDGRSVLATETNARTGTWRGFWLATGRLWVCAIAVAGGPEGGRREGSKGEGRNARAIYSKRTGRISAIFCGIFRDFSPRIRIGGGAGRGMDGGDRRRRAPGEAGRGSAAAAAAARAREEGGWLSITKGGKGD